MAISTDQHVLADDNPLALDKRHQHIKGATAEVDRLTVGEELAATRHDPETAELGDRRRFGRKIHSRGQRHLRGAGPLQSWRARELIFRVSRPTFQEYSSG